MNMLFSNKYVILFSCCYFLPACFPAAPFTIYNSVLCILPSAFHNSLIRYTLYCTITAQLLDYYCTITAQFSSYGRENIGRAINNP